MIKMFQILQPLNLMSKQLLIIRHAKSDWGEAGLKDFDRSLNKRGERDAPEMAKRLLKKNIVPQRLVSSPAKRALTTAKHFAEMFNINKNLIQQEKDIYEASLTDLMKVINALDSQFELIALFGHNPGLTNLVQHLCEARIYDIPTCGIVLIEFPFDDWKMISGNTGEMVFFDFPKNED